MNALRSVARKLAGLFIDDKLFALAIAAWLAAIGALTALHLGSPQALAFGLFAGLALILIASTIHAATKRV